MAGGALLAMPGLTHTSGVTCGVRLIAPLVCPPPPGRPVGTSGHELSWPLQKHTRAERNAWDILRPGLGTGTASLPPQSVGQQKSSVWPRFTGWGHRPCFLVGRARKLYLGGYVQEEEYLHPRLQIIYHMVEPRGSLCSGGQ